jgi:DNA-binding protein YbaB
MVNWVAWGGRTVTWAGLDRAQERLQSWAARVSQQTEAAVAMSDRVAGLKSTGETLDGAVRVRVDAAGRLVDLYLDEAVREVPAGELASAVLRAVAAAQHRLSDLVAGAVAATVGTESETGRRWWTATRRSIRIPSPQRSPVRPVRTSGSGTMTGSGVIRGG